MPVFGRSFVEHCLVHVEVILDDRIRRERMNAFRRSDVLLQSIHSAGERIAMISRAAIAAPVAQKLSADHIGGVGVSNFASQLVQFETIQSSRVLGKVVQDLHLDERTIYCKTLYVCTKPRARLRPGG